MKWDYFVSYAHEDREAVMSLVEAIESLGSRCFVDFRDISPGSQNYRTEQARAIKASETLLLVLSPHSQVSSEVAMELQFAHEAGRRKVAIWRSPQLNDLRDDLSLLLTSVQRIDWFSDRQDSVAGVAQKVTAITTLVTLHRRLTDYSSISDILRSHLESAFLRIEANERDEAMVEIGQAAVKVLRPLWERYDLGSPPETLGELVTGCRDHFEHESLVTAFSTVVHYVKAGELKTPTIDILTTALDALMVAMSTLQSDRWGTDHLLPQLRRSAHFLVGLVNEAGWLLGSQLAPRPDVVYLLFEKPGRESQRYLELIVGEDPETVAAMAEESLGTIIPALGVPTCTRFLVVSGALPNPTPETKLITVGDFVQRFTGLKPTTKYQPSSLDCDCPAKELRHAFSRGSTNLLLYGGAATGKTTALRDLADHGWPEAPAFRFHVDLAEAEPNQAEAHLDACLGLAFPPSIRDRAKGLASFLVRSGQAALLVDSIELLANAAHPKQAANSFARLCLFLSHESNVVLAGRDTTLRDSATIRDFLMDTPSTTDRLAQVMKIRGVDSSSLPKFSIIRARPCSSLLQVTTPQSRFIQELCNAISDDDESHAATRLKDAIVGDVALDSLLQLPALPRQVIEPMALGCHPPKRVSLGSEWFPDVAAHRCLIEFRAAVDYVTAATSGEVTHWLKVQVGEGTRRYIRLLSVMLGRQSASSAKISLVGPPGSIFAIASENIPRLSDRTVTVEEYREFLAVLPRWLPTAETEFQQHAASLQPFFARLPPGYFTDPAHGSHPATTVSWWGASAYARWRMARLPSSLEWEIAGRGWDGRIFPWGDDPLTSNINCAETLAGHALVDYKAWREAMRANEVATASAQPSCSSGPNTSVAGNLDMVGNVWEWTQTEAGQFRVIAGGSYDNPLRACTLFSRGTYHPGGKSNAVGFRLVAA